MVRFSSRGLPERLVRLVTVRTALLLTTHINCVLALMIIMSEHVRSLFCSTHCSALMDIGLITGCVGVGVRPLKDPWLQEILVSINAIVQAYAMPNSLSIMDGI